MHRNTLVETSAKWLESIRAIASNPEPDAPVATSDHPTDAFLRAQQMAEDFVSSPLVRELQGRLKDKAQKEDNWLSDCK